LLHKLHMGNLKKKRRLKMNKHKRRKRLKSNRHKKPYVAEIDRTRRALRRVFLLNYGKYLRAGINAFFAL